MQFLVQSDLGSNFGTVTQSFNYNMHRQKFHESAQLYSDARLYDMKENCCKLSETS